MSKKDNKPGSKIGPPQEINFGMINKVLILARADKEQHLQSLIKGRIRASHLEKYKAVENKDKPFFDDNESVGALFDSEKIIIKLSKDGHEIAEARPTDPKFKIFGRSDLPVSVSILYIQAKNLQSQSTG